MPGTDDVVRVFDSLASQRAWENLYSRKIDRLSYNFVSRQRAVEELLKDEVSGNVLDLGCGTGDLLPFFASRNVLYTGLDLSSKMIERASANHATLVSSGNAKFLTGDSENIPFDDNQFHIVTAIALVEYFPDPTKALDEIARVLKPGGVAVITVPHKSCINFAIRDLLEPARNAFYPLYLRLKGRGLSAMKDVKHYAYDSAELDALLVQRRLTKIGERYSNYYVVPHPFDHLVPKLYIRLSELVERASAKQRFNRLAANYLGLYKKQLI
jgi:ubiquinone/menaquinone biosynthesis C-methylase UbiE